MIVAEGLKRRGWSIAFTAFLAGAVTALALPPFHVVPVLFITIPVLLDLIGSASSYIVAARRGWFFGFGLHLVGLYWITEAIMLEATRFWWLIPLAVPALAAVLAIFIALATGTARVAQQDVARILIFAGAWVLLDIARQFIATGFPWNPLGSVWEFPGLAGDIFIQPAAWVGVHGLTLATLLISSAPAFGIRGYALGALGLVCWASFGGYRIVGADALKVPEPRVEVIVLQGNVAQGMKWDQAERLNIFARYLRLSRPAPAYGTSDAIRVVVWPETASPFLIDDDPAARQAIASAAKGAWSLVGAVRFDMAGRPRNSLMVLKPDGEVATHYDKWHLVPFGEYQPSWLPLGIQLVPGGGLKPGPGPQILTVGTLPSFDPLICYEAIFSGQILPSAGRPAWIVNITNDGWFGNSTGPRQHLAAARMRAVEEGLPLVRAANTGISAFFNAYGHESGRLGLGTEGALSELLPPALDSTPFSRLGLIIPLVLSLCCLSAAAIVSRWAAAKTSL